MENPENSFDEKTANLHMKRVISHQMTLQNNARKTADDLISETFSLIKHFYGKQESYFYVKVKSYLREECQKQKRKINEHLDKLVYLGL